MNTLESIVQLKQRMAESIIGQETVIERLLIALLANGNVLMESLPGLAKTRAIKTLSRHVESEFRRIQFTPGGKLKQWIHVGASPRGTLALDRASRAHAWLRGRDHVLPDEVHAWSATACATG